MAPKSSSNQPTPIDFKSFSDQNTASIQFSYPAVDNVIYETASNSFFLPNNSVTPNFSYTDAQNNLYISGASVRGYIRSNSPASLTTESRELVLEHQQANSDKKFYVVIPIKSDDKSRTTLSKLNDKSKIVLDLNTDISNKNTIYHYKSKPGNIHVFVFDQPVTVKGQFVPGGNVPTGLPNSTTGMEQMYKVRSPTKVEDEIVCGFSEDAPAAKKGEDKVATTTTYSFAMLLLNIVIIITCLHLMVTYKDVVYKPLLYGSLLSFFVLFILVIVYRSYTNYSIVTGSLLFTSCVISVMCFLAMNPNSFFGKMWKSAVETKVSTTTTTPTEIPKGLYNAAALITGKHT
jgi:hypothetical protein